MTEEETLVDVDCVVVTVVCVNVGIVEQDAYNAIRANNYEVD